MSDYISIEEAAKLLNTSERTIYRLVEERRLTPYKPGIKRKTVYKRKEVLGLLIPKKV